MDYTTLGRTGLKVSVAGLGGGGSSRLGKAQGKSFEHSVSIVREAMDLGINFIDTAVVYRTEEIVGAAIKGKRDKVVLSSKVWVIRDGAGVHDLDFCTSTEFVERVEGSLRRLGTDYIDVYHLHGVTAEQLQHGVNEFVPLLEKLRDQGKIRFIGITERFISDTTHEAASRALDHDCWDVMMLGFNFLNPSARKEILQRNPETRYRRARHVRRAPGAQQSGRTAGDPPDRGRGRTAGRRGRQGRHTGLPDRTGRRLDASGGGISLLPARAGDRRRAHGDRQRRTSPRECRFDQ